MRRQRDDGIPVRGRAANDGLKVAANGIAKTIILTGVAVGVVGSAVAVVAVAYFWSGHRQDVAVLANPSREMNHKEVVAHLQNRGVRCHYYEGRSNIFGTYCDVSTDATRFDSDPCVRIYKVRSEREAHDLAGTKAKSFDWGLFVFEQHGDTGDLLAQIRDALP